MLDTRTRPRTDRLLSPLYRERLRRDVSLLAVAGAVDIALADLLDMEWQLRLPTPEQAQRLAGYYGTTVGALFGDA